MPINPGAGQTVIITEKSISHPDSSVNRECLLGVDSRLLAISTIEGVFARWDVGQADYL